MAMTGNAMALGVFRDHALADDAANELRMAGFQDDQITYISSHSDGALGGLKNLFSRQHTNANTEAPGMLANLPLSAPERDYYQRELDAGHTILAVQANDREQDASAILSRHGAYNAGAMPLDQSTRVIPLRAEELHVDKQTVMSGEIRVHKRVVTEERTFTVPVTREELIIEHIAHTDSPDHIRSDRSNTIIERKPPTEADATAAVQGAADEILRDGGIVRIVLHEDQVIINKQTVVTEEVVIRKELVQEMRQVTDTARHEEMRVGSIGNPIIRANNIDVTNEVQNEA